RFLLCGAGMVGKNAELVGLLHQAGVHNHFHLLDLRDEMISFYNALDLLSSSSASGEGFPQVVGEAMACGVPCVVTDVGDSALIVGGTGRVVPPCNPVALAAAWEEMLRMPPADRTRLGQTARQRIQENFSIEKIAGQYEALYSSILAEGRA
ncbi:MAG: glycosyltransferase, partial [Anaerolineaceae bacterium]|nr:glycosyltransferase [Anaerolineaceae bacterium]